MASLENYGSYWVVDDEPVFDIGVVDDAIPSNRALQQVRDSQRRAKRTGLLLALGAIAVAVAVLIAVPLLTRGDDRVLSQEPTALPVPTTQLEGLGGPGDETEVGDNGAASFQPPSAEHLRADDVGALFATQLDSPTTSYGIAYIAGDDFVVLDSRGITVPDLLIAQTFATVSQLALLTSGGRTWAIDTEDRDLNYLVSNTYVVIESERPDTIAVINPDSLLSIGLLSSSLPVPSVELPDGAELLWVQGRGVLVLPRTGGTFEVTGTASSLVRISDDRAVAASLDAVVYERCDDQLRCTFRVDRAGEEVDVALDFRRATAFTPSPDGRWVVADDADAVWLIDLSSGEELMLADGPVTALDWAPDSSFVALVRDDLLEMVPPATGESVVVQLNHSPDPASLLVFASPAAASDT